MIALMLSATALAGCAGGTLVYDPYWHDYHRWNSGESRYYQQWELNGHRHHVDFSRRTPAEQRAYWGWRHH